MFIYISIVYIVISPYFVDIQKEKTEFILKTQRMDVVVLHKKQQNIIIDTAATTSFLSKRTRAQTF